MAMERERRNGNDHDYDGRPSLIYEDALLDALKHFHPELDPDRSSVSASRPKAAADGEGGTN